MKQLLVALLLGISSIIYSQDTLQIPAVELEEFFLALDTLRTQDSIKTILINDLEYQVILYERLTEQDSLIISYKDQEIQLLNEQILLYEKRLNKVDKWYNKPWVGALGGFVGTLAIINITAELLPQ